MNGDDTGPDTVVPVTADRDGDDTGHDDGATDDATEERTRWVGMTARQLIALAIVVPFVLVAAFLGGRALRDDTDGRGLRIEAVAATGDFDWNYEIPNGTAARIEAGETVQIVPAELVVTVGDTIRIVNDDTVGHVVGVFFVGAGETMTQQFQSAGEFTGDCSVHPTGQFTLRVEAA